LNGKIKIGLNEIVRLVLVLRCGADRVNVAGKGALAPCPRQQKWKGAGTLPPSPEGGLRRSRASADKSLCPPFMPNFP
jgi:hypothetical protein